MVMSKTRVARVLVPADGDVIFADEYDEPGTKVGEVDGVIAYDRDRERWLVYSNHNKLIEIKERGDLAWDFVNKFWEPAHGADPEDRDFWDGAPETIGKWMRGEV